MNKVVRWKNDRDLEPLRRKLDQLLSEVHRVLIQMEVGHAMAGKSDLEIFNLTIKEFKKSAKSVIKDFERR